jgi:RNA polymerase sigma-70 factor (ECF subfamily)
MPSDEDSAFSAAYSSNYADVLRYVQRRASPANVDDVVAETFAVAWRRRDALPAEPRAWLFRTASNVMKSTARRDARHKNVALRSWEPPHTGADLVQGLDVIAAWRQLARRDQEAIALHAWEELSDQEAAAVLGCTRATYTMRLSRAKRRLAKILRPAVEPSRADQHLQPYEGTS